MLHYVRILCSVENLGAFLGRHVQVGQRPSFDALGLSPVMLDSLRAAEYLEPTPIQAGLIPLALLAQAWGPLLGSMFDLPVRARFVAWLDEGALE